jgi:predicted permease
MREFLRRVWYLIRQRQFEADLAQEMEFHRAMSNGRGFGNATLAREDSRAVWIWPWLESLWQDGAYAGRNLRRQPGFTAVVLLVLATVIGLHATLVTVLAGVMLRPWPGIKDPGRVVALYLRNAQGQPRPGPSFSIADVRDLAPRAASFEAVAAMASSEVRVGSGDAVRSAGALFVSGNFFELLGIEMARGRGFAANEDRMGDPSAVTVLSYDFWQSRFGGDQAIVGQAVRLNDVIFTIVGVSSREFGGSEPAYGKSVFLPVAALALVHADDPSPSGLADKSDFYRADVVARLARGVSRRQAQAELDLLSRDYAAPDGTKPRGSIVTDTAFFSHPGRMTPNGPLVAASLVSAGLLLVWLLACANIGNLMLARAAARTREIGIRLSLGASRPRIVRQLLTEGFVHALAAGTLGVAVAYELPFVILRLMGGATASFPFRVAVDGVVVGYAVLIAALSALAFGLAPALHATRADVAHALAEHEGLPAWRFPLRGVLLGIQVAVSVVLLVSAGLLVRAVQHQSTAFDPGFSVNDVSVVSFELPPGGYDDARTHAFVTGMTAALRALPSGAIDASGFTSAEPSFLRRGFHTFFRLPGEPPEQGKPIMFSDVSPGYFNVLQIPIVAGRDFEPADQGRPVALINEAMARQYWPHDNPIGKTFVKSGGGLVRRGAGPPPSEVREIIGVVKNAHTNSLYEFVPMFYQVLSAGRPMPKLVVRTSGPVPSSEIARLAQRLDSNVRTQTIALAATLEERMQETKTGPILAGVLGACALALATVGMFGVFAYAVRQRTREIGIRMALGAQPSAVVRLVLGGHSRAVVGGLVAGLVGGMAASVILRSRLHGLSPFDPATYLGVAAILTVAGLAASYVPARRATRVDPVVALRHE